MVRWKIRFFETILFSSFNHFYFREAKAAHFSNISQTASYAQRLHVHTFKISQPWGEDQTDSDSLLNTPVLQLLTKNHSLKTFNDQNETDAEKFEKEVINVLIQTDFDTLSETGVPPKHGCSSVPVNFPNQAATQYFKLKVDAERIFFNAKWYIAC